MPQPRAGDMPQYVAPETWNEMVKKGRGRTMRRESAAFLGQQSFRLAKGMALLPAPETKEEASTAEGGVASTTANEKNEPETKLGEVRPATPPAVVTTNTITVGATDTPSPPDSPRSSPGSPRSSSEVHTIRRLSRINTLKYGALKNIGAKLAGKGSIGHGATLPLTSSESSSSATSASSTSTSSTADHRLEGGGVGKLLSDATESIPAYVEQSTLMIVLVPVCQNNDNGDACTYQTWRGKLNVSHATPVTAHLHARYVRSAMLWRHVWGTIPHASAHSFMHPLTYLICAYIPAMFRRSRVVSPGVPHRHPRPRPHPGHDHQRCVEVRLQLYTAHRCTRRRYKGRGGEEVGRKRGGGGQVGAFVAY